MSRAIPEPNTIAPPRTGSEPVRDGTHAFRHEALEEREKNGKLTYLLRSTVIESASDDELDKTLFVTLWIGTDNDPMAADPLTWQSKENDAGLWAALARSVGMGNIRDADDLCQQIPGRESLVTVYIDKKGYNRARAFYTLGEKKLEVRGQQPQPNGAAPAVQPGTRFDPAKFATVAE